MKTSKLISPASLRRDLPLTADLAHAVGAARQSVTRILDGHDDRLLVIVGPCSVHDPISALEYAERLAKMSASLADRLMVVMRTYFEKPRTRLGWKGFINDPGLDGTHDINIGLRISRKLLLDILALGLAAGCEFLDPFTPAYIADAISWACIGARTCHSPVHRQLASGLPIAVGFKNPPDGDVQAAINAVTSAASPHVFMTIDDNGVGIIRATTGNPHGHLVLRGGYDGPNYSAAHIADTLRRLAAEGQRPKVVIDASHGNSNHDQERQVAATEDIAGRYASGDPGIAGIMIESFLEAGRQDLPDAGEGAVLTFGQSITDSCLDWNSTARLMSLLAQAVNDRRSLMYACLRSRCGSDS